VPGMLPAANHPHASHIAKWLYETLKQKRCMVACELK